jgi:hypothetical protein
MSFTAATRVLLASGAAVPISQLKPGDKVLATNTKTGKTQPEAVTAVLVHHDTDLYDLMIRDHGNTAVIDTTTSHLFWVPGTGGHGGRWVKAGALKYGTHLRAPGGSGTAVVAGGWIPAQRDGWMWDLTVPGGGDHDFYIDTFAAAILVHNCPRFEVNSSGTATDLEGPTGVQLNEASGNAFRDTVAGFLRSMGRNVVTDGEDRSLMTFDTPYGPRIFDMGVTDDEGNVLGYVETKMGSSPYGGLQALKDAWLQENQGLNIAVVYGGS